MNDAEKAWAEIRRAVNLSWLAEQLHLTPAAVSAWNKVPPERIIEIELLTGVPRERLRPDLYRHPDPWSAL